MREEHPKSTTCFPNPRTLTTRRAQFNTRIDSMHALYLGRQCPNREWCWAQSWCLVPAFNMPVHHSSGQTFLGDGVHGKMMNLTFINTVLCCLRHEVGYVFQRSFVSHTVSMDQEFSRLLVLRGKAGKPKSRRKYLWKKRWFLPPAV